MFKSPIKSDGSIRYTEIIKYSVLIGLFYAFLSSFISNNESMLMISSASLTSVVVLLSTINIFILSLGIIDILKEYVKTKLFVYLKESVIFVLFTTESFIEHIIYFTEDIFKRNNVIRC